MTTQLLDPPPFMGLAGHPVRWRLLSELTRSDRRVSELTELVGEPQNLVSYHLGKLRKAALVSARRSSADGRDSYYAVDLTTVRASLAATAHALHPGLQLAPPPPVDPRELVPLGMRVLFLCTGNSARSQMAEALLADRSGRTVEVSSAGSHPKVLHPNAIRVMRDEYGLDLAGHQPKHVDTLADLRFDRVITLCDRVREVCPNFPGAPETSHWSMPDPGAESDDDEASYPAFQRAARELDARIGFLLAALAEDSDPTNARQKEQS